MDNVEQIIHEFPMIISKSSLYQGEMRWSAVNSDTDWDLYGERMTLELYKGMIAKIKSNVPPPEPFAELVTSDYWKGGMPYLSIAHYSDGNGNAVPGDVRELFIDGNQLKAKGTLHDSPLGKAVWKSLKQDEVNYKNDTDTDRIRISIAFLDLAHKHGEDGAIFRRKSFTDVCPECQRGVGEKIYVDGYLVHLALTRVPVNPRTIMEAEDAVANKSNIRSKKDDAISVLGGDVELAEQVEKSGLEFRSDAIIEMSDTPEAIDAPEPVEEKSYGEVEQVQIWKPYGGATSMKEAKKFVEAQQESWRVSDLYYTFTDVARNIMDSDEIEDKAGALATLVDEFKKSLVAKSLYEELSQIKEGTLEEAYMTVKKSDLEETVLAAVAKAITKEEPVVEKSADGDMDDEEKKKKAKEDKMAEKSDIVSETPAPVQKSALDVAVDELYNVVNGVIGKAGTSEEKLQEVQPALQNLGSAIISVVKSSTNEAVAQPLPQNDAVLEAINNLTGLVNNALTEVATIKAQIANPNVQNTNRVPVPRSIAPQVVKSDVPQNVPAESPNSIKSVIRRSVGL